MNVPNSMTALRFLITPFFGYFLFKEQYHIAVSLFLLGGITDILDGYIARKYHLITSFGKLADPLADKLMQVTALVLLTMQNKLPVIILIIVVAKEIFMGAGSILLYKKENHVVSANWYGKLATVIFFLAIVMILFNLSFSNILAYIAVSATLFAFFMYSLAFKKIRKE